MPILTMPVDPTHLRGAPPEPSPLVVVTLCAAWCNTCEAFCAALESIAAAHPRTRFVWLDIEDDAALCGDVEVENFPTIVAFRGTKVLHYGVTLPTPGVVRRLVEALEATATPLGDAPEEVRALCVALLGGAHS